MRRDGRQRREAILDAALRCFARRGVAATGIEEIRREAGASASSVYHHFGGRNEVLLALLIRIFERSLSRLADRVVRATSARGFVETLVRAHIEWVRDHRDEAGVMYQALSLELAPELGEGLQDRKAELLAPVVEHALPFIVRGELPAWTPIQVDVVILGATHEGCRRWLGGAELELDWMLETFPELAWKSLQGGQAQRA
ncbi:MAG: TetR/AcrR family transcriptional regulator [Myxococcota bacterium]